MTVLVSAILSVFGGFFSADGRETISLFEKQKKAGFSWHYTGSMSPPPKTRFFSLKTSEGENLVFFQLKRHSLKEEIAEFEE